MENKERLKKKVEECLDVPGKAIEGDTNKDIEKNLGIFLVEKEYIKGVDEREEDWGFVYRSAVKKIAVSKKEMPHRKWEDCIFKMGINEKTGEDLFPSPGRETEKYRFLHEANHAYQEYLCSLESKESPESWYQKVVEGEVESCYGNLFSFCFQKRMEGEEKGNGKGLSIWGNAPNYSREKDRSIPNRLSEMAVRAQEDANELVTMFLWHPKYFEVYLDYLSLNHNNPQVREKELTKEDLEKAGLISLPKEEAEYLRELVLWYIEEMKKTIGKESSM